MDWTKPLVLIIAAGVVTFALSLVVAQAPPDKHGWRHLKPSGLHWAGLIMGSVLCPLFAFFRVFVQPSSADAEQQMNLLTGLIVGFGLITIISILAIKAVRKRAVRWRVDTIAFAGASGVEKRRLGEVTRIGTTKFGQVMLTFDDETKVAVDPYARGAAEMLKRIRTRLENPDAPQD